MKTIRHEDGYTVTVDHDFDLKETYRLIKTQMDYDREKYKKEVAQVLKAKSPEWTDEIALEKAEIGLKELELIFKEYNF